MKKGKSLVFLAFVLWLYIGSGIFFLSYTPLARVNSPQEQKDFMLADGEYWLNPWAYRKSITIDAGGYGGGGGPAIVNYTIELDVNYGSGSDSGNSVYCSSHCQTDFDDIRFTDDNGITELNYWLEEYTVSDDATFWVRVEDDLTSEQTIYIYYGNSAASTTSNGTNTFLHFDDFETNDLTDRWNEIGDEWSIQSSVKKRGTYAAFGDSGSWGAAERWLTWNERNFTTSLMVHTWFRVTALQTSYKYGMHFYWSTNIAGVIAYFLGFITGILLLIIEKDNKFVRFHAAQSTVLSGGLFILGIILGFIPIIGWIIGLFLPFVGLILWLYLMYMAYQGNLYRLPVIADYADKLEAMF